MTRWSTFEKTVEPFVALQKLGKVNGQKHLKEVIMDDEDEDDDYWCWVL